MKKTLRQKQTEALASIIYNMGRQDLGVKYAIATLKEALEAWSEEDQEMVIVCYHCEERTKIDSVDEIYKLKKCPHCGGKWRD